MAPGTPWTEDEVEGAVILGRAALVRTERATGRLKDLADLEALGEGS